MPSPSEVFATSYAREAGKAAARSADVQDAPADGPETPVNAPETSAPSGAGTETPPDPADVSTDAPEPDGDEQDGPEDADDVTGKGKAARQAQRYREQLRATETQLRTVQDERDAATAQVDALRTEIARKLAENFGLVRGSELDVPVSELLDEESGLVDSGKVARAVARLREEKPYLRNDLGSEAWRNSRPMGHAEQQAHDIARYNGGSSWSGLLRG